MPKSDSTHPAAAQEALTPPQQEFVDALGQAIVVALGDRTPSRPSSPSQQAKKAALAYGRIRRALRTHLEPAPAVVK